MDNNNTFEAVSAMCSKNHDGDASGVNDKVDNSVVQGCADGSAVSNDETKITMLRHDIFDIDTESFFIDNLFCDNNNNNIYKTPTNSSPPSPAAINHHVFNVLSPFSESTPPSLNVARVFWTEERIKSLKQRLVKAEQQYFATKRSENEQVHGNSIPGTGPATTNNKRSAPGPIAAAQQRPPSKKRKPSSTRRVDLLPITPAAKYLGFEDLERDEANWEYKGWSHRPVVHKHKLPLRQVWQKKGVVKVVEKLIRTKNKLVGLLENKRVNGNPWMDKNKLLASCDYFKLNCNISKATKFGDPLYPYVTCSRSQILEERTGLSDTKTAYHHNKIRQLRICPVYMETYTAIVSKRVVTLKLEETPPLPLLPSALKPIKM